MNDSEIQAIANQVGVNTRRLIIEELDRRTRLPTGVDSGGPFNQFSVNDQGNIIDASIPLSRRFDVGTSTSAINDSTTVEASFINEYQLNYDAITDASWFDASTPKRIVVPVTGAFLITVQPYWRTDNQTGDRFLEIVQERDSVSSHFQWYAFDTMWSARNTTRYFARYHPVAWIYDVVAGDAFRMYIEHNGGVNTLKCQLDVVFQQLTSYKS